LVSKEIFSPALLLANPKQKQYITMPEDDPPSESFLLAPGTGKGKSKSKKAKKSKKHVAKKAAKKKLAKKKPAQKKKK
jgi:hypothetical protein